LIKTVITVLITLAILNAAVRMGGAAVSYYQLKDEAQQLIVFGARSTTQDLHQRILLHAEELGIPLAAEDLYVSRDGNRTYVDAYYTQPVEILPNMSVPVQLSFSVDSFAVATATGRR
jgi:hypothetical protein